MHKTPKLLLFFSSSIRMSEKNIIFDNKKINKSNFYKNKKLSKIDEVDVDRILVWKEESYGTKNSLKYFIAYNENDVIRPLYIKFLQMIGYVKHFDSNKATSFKVIDNKLLKKYTKIWERSSSLMNIEFNSEPVCGDNDKYIKTKIKSHGDKVNINFQGKESIKRKCIIQVFIVDNAGSCYLSK